MFDAVVRDNRNFNGNTVMLSLGLERKLIQAGMFEPANAVFILPFLPGQLSHHPFNNNTLT